MIYVRTPTGQEFNVAHLPIGKIKVKKERYSYMLGPFAHRLRRDWLENEERQRKLLQSVAEENKDLFNQILKMKCWLT